MFIASRRDLLRLTIVRRPHGPDKNGTQRTASPVRDGSPRPDSPRLRQSYDTQRDTRIQDSLNRAR